MAAYYYHGSLDYDQALRSLSRAEEAMAGDAFFLETKAAIHRRRGDHEYALDIFEMALDQSPRSTLLHLDMLASYFSLQRYDDMLAIASRLEQLDVSVARIASIRAWAKWGQSGTPEAIVLLANDFSAEQANNFWVISLGTVLSAFLVTGQQDQIGPYIDAREQADTGGFEAYSILRARFDVTMDPGKLRAELESDLQRLQIKAQDDYVAPFLRSQIAEILIHLDRKDEARKLLLGLLTDPLVIRDRFIGPIVVAGMAYRFTQLGDHERAIEALESALAAGTGLSLRTMMQNPGMEVLEQYPQFSELVEKYGWVNEDLSKGLGQ
jgi:tetratricopeptide (TPR) repeat protein